MAPKKRLPLVDDPPTASSSDEEQPPSTQKPADKVVNEEDEDSSSSEEGSSSEEVEEENQIQQTPSKDSKPASKNPPPSTPISNPKPAESDSESGTESDSEAEQKSEPTPPPNPKVKPLASKPMKTQSTPVPTKSGTKRAAESSSGNDSKRSKKKTTAGGGSDDENEVEEDVKLTGEDSKKNSQRVFSEEDELAILKMLGDFVAKTGKDPMKDAAAFHSFAKKSMKAEANAEQLKRKVRGLKKKFESSDNFTKAHDKRAFDLFKVWSKNASKEAEENGKSNEKIAKSAKKEATSKNGGSAKKELAIVTKNESGKVEGGVGKSFILSELVKFDEAAGIAALDKDAAKRGLELMGESDRVDLEERWKKLQAAEMDVFVNRAEVVRVQTRLALQDLKKKSSK